MKNTKCKTPNCLGDSFTKGFCHNCYNNSRYPKKKRVIPSYGLQT